MYHFKSRIPVSVTKKKKRAIAKSEAICLNTKLNLNGSKMARYYECRVRFQNNWEDCLKSSGGVADQKVYLKLVQR